MFILSSIQKGNFTVLLLSTVWLLSRRIALPPRARYAANALAAMAWIQVRYYRKFHCNAHTKQFFSPIVYRLH